MNKPIATIAGTIMKGTSLGRKMGFPTINVVYDTINLTYGVYAAMVKICSGTYEGKFYKGALHFGPRRVLNMEEPSLEVHLLDFSDNLYGESVEIQVFDKVRQTRDFESLDALKKQIRLDIEAIRNIFENHAHN